MSRPNHMTKVKRNRVKNLTTGRLLGHRLHLHLVMIDGPNFEGSRMDWAVKAGALWCIENELERRGVSFNRRTTRATRN